MLSMINVISGIKESIMGIYIIISQILVFGGYV
jgi:hypothetical protein